MDKWRMLAGALLPCVMGRGGWVLLDWAEGTFPTPYGVLEVRHEKQPDGSVKTSVKLPKEIKRI